MANLNSLIFGAPTEEDKALAMAEALRGKRNAAQLMSLSTLSPLSTAGTAEVGRVDDSAKRAGALRVNEIERRDRLAREKQAQRNFEKTFAYNQQRDAEANALKKSIADIKSGGKGSIVSNMPASERAKYRASLSALKKFPQVIKSIEDNPDAFGMGTAPAEYLPEWAPNFISEPVKDLRAAKFTEDQREARNAVYRESYQTIKELAGTAVSKHEKGRIEQFLPSPNDEPQVIADKMRSAMDYARNNLESFRIYGDVDMSGITPEDMGHSDRTDAPEGFSAEEWNALTLEEKNEVLTGD